MAEAALAAHGGDLEGAMQALVRLGRAGAAATDDDDAEDDADDDDEVDEGRFRGQAGALHAALTAAPPAGASRAAPTAGPGSRVQAAVPGQRIAASAAMADSVAAAAGDEYGRELAARAQALAEQRGLADEIRGLLGSLRAQINE